MWIIKSFTQILSPNSRSLLLVPTMQSAVNQSLMFLFETNKHFSVIVFGMIGNYNGIIAKVQKYKKKYLHVDIKGSSL